MPNGVDNRLTNRARRRGAALREYYGDSRLEFYSAESLRTFSRDTLPPGEFEKLQDEVHGNIRDEVPLLKLPWEQGNSGKRSHHFLIPSNSMGLENRL
jgi:hypothetical protein